MYRLETNGQFKCVQLEIFVRKNVIRIRKCTNIEYRRNNRFCHFLKLKDLIKECLLHEDIYCRLPALGLRANDALTQSLADVTTRTERNWLLSEVLIWLDSFGKSHSNADTTEVKSFTNRWNTAMSSTSKI